MTSSISRTCSTSPSESGALNSRHSSVVVAATPRTSSIAPTKSMLALTTTVSTASTTASRSTTTTTATHERRGFRSNAKKKALPAIAALGIFFLLLLSFEVLDRCLFYNDYYLRDHDAGIGNYGGNHGNGSPPMPPRADQSLVKRHLRSMAFLLWNASEHPPLAAVRRDGKGGNNLDGDGDGNGSRSLSDNNYVGNDDETKDGLSHGDIHDMSDNDNTRNTNFSSNGRTSHLQVLTQEAQRSNRKPMSDIHSDDLESWAEVEGKSEKQWPPREIMDGLVDEMKRVVVIAVNCGFLDMADNYLNSVVQQGVENYVVVPLDSVAHRVMSEAYPGHVLPMPPELQTNQTPTVLTTSAYNTENFRILTSLRPSILLRFLRGGYSPFYNDVDMVWKANLFTTLMEIHHSNKAFLVRGKGGTYGDGANTSTIFMRPTEENMRFVLAWKEEMEMMDANGEKMKHANDQFGFNAVLNGREAGRDLPRIFGDSERFPSFKDYFWEGGGKEEKKEAEKRRKKALLVHNNGLKTKEDKIKRFQKFGLWELSGRLGEYQCEDVVAVGADAFAGGIEKSTS